MINLFPGTAQPSFYHCHAYCKLLVYWPCSHRYAWLLCIHWVRQLARMVLDTSAATKWVSACCPIWSCLNDPIYSAVFDVLCFTLTVWKLWQLCRCLWSTAFHLLLTVLLHPAKDGLPSPMITLLSRDGKCQRSAPHIFPADRWSRLSIFHG